MVVQHNLMAMNANRMLGTTTRKQSKSTEKLSSGYKINRAADDAAGLAISEKMRRQIRGLTQASANAMDGISCVQTAEGALDEIHSMLQRINELAVKGGNGTLTTSDRDYVKLEVRALMSEIDRVHSTTTFNEQQLLDGTFKDKDLQVGAETGQHISINIRDMGSNALMASAISKAPVYTVSSSNDFCIQNCLGLSAAQGTHGFWYPQEGNCAIPGLVDRNREPLVTESRHGHLLGMRDLSVFHGFDYDGILDENVKNRILTGHNVPMDDQVMEDRHFLALLVFAKSAIEDVSKMRSELGAVQNRLEHTINNLDNIVENTTQAESRIRDTDMAHEMVDYSNGNILQQAGQAMLAQANQSNQGILSILG